MSASIATFDLATKWRPIAEAFATFQNECGSLVQCADSVFGEVDSIRGELAARARELHRLEEQLVLREGQLAEQRSDFAKLSSQFDQQAARLAETTEELGRLREEVSSRNSANLAADTAKLALEQAGQAWHHDRNEILERLNGLSIMQQTGSSDGEAVKAFCHELTEIHELIGSSHAQTRAALEAQVAHFDERMKTLREASAVDRPSDEALAKLSESLAELRAESNRQTEAYESVVNGLKAEIEQLRSALKESPGPVASSVTEEAIASLRAEIEAQRQAAEEARGQSQKHQTERAVLEAELDRVRTQAAQWRLQHEQEQAHHHEEEQRWHEELQDLRQLVRQATSAMGSPVQPALADAVAAKAGESPEQPDVVANSLLAQFAKLQKDSARRRTRGQ